MDRSNPPVPEDLIGLAEACRLIPSRKPGRHLSIASLFRWIQRGKIRGWRIGGSWFVSRAAVRALFVPSEPLPEIVTQEAFDRRQEEARAFLRERGYRI